MQGRKVLACGKRVLLPGKQGSDEGTRVTGGVIISNKLRGS